MSTQSTLSRIARSLTLRRAEVTAHLALVVVWTITPLLVGANYATEDNPVSALGMAHVGVYEWAVLMARSLAGSRSSAGSQSTTTIGLGVSAG